MTEKTIAVVPGDGIGIEVTREAVKVLRALEDVLGVRFRLTEYDYGAEKYLKTGISMPPGGLDGFEATTPSSWAPSAIPASPT